MAPTVDRVLTLEHLAEIELASGAHGDRAAGVCALEAVAWLAGEPHSDHPVCVSRVIGNFVRTWNDSLPDADRTRVLRPLLPRLLNTAASDALEDRRAWRVLDWFIREHVPAWLRLSETLAPHAETLQRLAPIADAASLAAAQPPLDAARDAAWAAAWAAARAAAWAAARDAAWDAARDAAWAAARAAAWAAARAAAWAAARDAAWAAARAAAWAAARDAAAKALAPTVLALQESAARLVFELCAMTEAA